MSILNEADYAKLKAFLQKLNTGPGKDVYGAVLLYLEKYEGLKKLVELQSKECRSYAIKFGARERRITEHFEERKALKEEIERLKKEVEWVRTRSFTGGQELDQIKKEYSDLCKVTIDYVNQIEQLKKELNGRYEIQSKITDELIATKTALDSAELDNIITRNERDEALARLK